VERRFPAREIDRQVRELVARARREYGLAEGCDGTTACRRLGLDLGEGSLPAKTDGLLSGNRIVLNDRITWPPRREFTVFHEITHYLLDEDGELIEYLTDAYRKDANAFRQELERCCNVGAAEFLMPQQRVYDAIREEGFSIGLLERIVARHGVSVVAAAQQLASCAPAGSYVVLAAASGGGVLSIEYAFTAPDTKYPLARFYPLAADHLFVTSWESHRRVSGPTYIPFRSGNTKPCYGEAQPLGGRVVGFLTDRRPPGAGQLALPLFGS